MQDSLQEEQEQDLLQETECLEQDLMQLSVWFVISFVSFFLSICVKDSKELLRTLVTSEDFCSSCFRYARQDQVVFFIYYIDWVLTFNTYPW